MLLQTPKLQLEKGLPTKPGLQTATQLLPCDVRLQKAGQTPFAGSPAVGGPEHAAETGTNCCFDEAAAAPRQSCIEVLCKHFGGGCSSVHMARAAASMFGTMATLPMLTLPGFRQLHVSQGANAISAEYGATNMQFTYHHLQLN
jgi:hypothetical protein